MPFDTINDVVGFATTRSDGVVFTTSYWTLDESRDVQFSAISAPFSGAEVPFVITWWVCHNILDMQREHWTNRCANTSATSPNITPLSVGRHEEHEGLGNVKLHVLQFGHKEPDSKESLEICIELERLGIHSLRFTTLWTYRICLHGPHYMIAC